MFVVLLSDEDEDEDGDEDRWRDWIGNFQSPKRMFSYSHSLYLGLAFLSPVYIDISGEDSNVLSSPYLATVSASCENRIPLQPTLFLLTKNCSSYFPSLTSYLLSPSFFHRLLLISSSGYFDRNRLESDRSRPSSAYLIPYIAGEKRFGRTWRYSV